MVLREVEVSCLPRHIPGAARRRRLATWRIRDVLTCSDLKVPEGVRVLNDPGQAVVTVAPPMAEEAVVARGGDGSGHGRARGAHRAQAEGRRGSGAERRRQEAEAPKKAEKRSRVAHVAHVVVGLGNPGAEYRDTRHNVGQRVVDALADEPLGRKPWRATAATWCARGRWRGEAVYPGQAAAFMNVCGPVVARLAAAARRRARRPDPRLSTTSICRWAPCACASKAARAATTASAR